LHYRCHGSIDLEVRVISYSLITHCFCPLLQCQRSKTERGERIEAALPAVREVLERGLITLTDVALYAPDA
jgi:hypothetical protein